MSRVSRYQLAPRGVIATTTPIVGRGCHNDALAGYIEDLDVESLHPIVSGFALADFAQ
jgi:hypothetical protein